MWTSPGKITWRRSAGASERTTWPDYLLGAEAGELD
jgi:hypothetical protein